MRHQIGSFKAIFIIFGICGLLMWYLLTYIQSLKGKARDQMCIEMLNIIKNAEKVYFDEFGQYSSNLNSLGVSHVLENVKVFFSKDSMPEVYRTAIPEIYFPFMKEDSYQIIAVMSINSFCVTSDRTETKMIGASER